MSHFYGTLQGTRGKATRCGAKSSGITTQAASWSGAIETRLYFDEETGKDMFEVYMIPWHGRGESQMLVRGEVGIRESVGHIEFDTFMRPLLRQQSKRKHGDNLVV